VKQVYSRARGFTLLELMVTLCVAAIIAAFAVPGYRSHVARAHRLEAATALHRAAQFVEAALAARTSGSSADPVALAAGFDQAPANGAPFYTLRLLTDSATNGGYAIEAEPVATGPMQGDPCGVFIIDATGARSNRAEAELGPTRIATCWSGQ
jgi:type IV pilus assembly protein PilE